MSFDEPADEIIRLPQRHWDETLHEIAALEAENTRLRRAGGCLACQLAEAREALKELRHTFRANMLKFCPTLSHGEIDVLLDSIAAITPPSDETTAERQAREMREWNI